MNAIKENLDTIFIVIAILTPFVLTLWHERKQTERLVESITDILRDMSPKQQSFLAEQYASSTLKQKQIINAVIGIGDWAANLTESERDDLVIAQLRRTIGADVVGSVGVDPARVFSKDEIAAAAKE